MVNELDQFFQGHDLGLSHEGQKFDRKSKAKD